MVNQDVNEKVNGIVSNKDKRRSLIIRLIRIAFITVVLFVLLFGVRPEDYLPEGRSLSDVIEGALGGAILGGVIGAVLYRIWQNFKNK